MSTLTAKQKHDVLRYQRKLANHAAWGRFRHGCLLDDLKQSPSMDPARTAANRHAAIGYQKDCADIYKRLQTALGLES